MEKAEILELMRLNRWSMSRLAGELDLSEGAVRRWINEERLPGGPAAKLMKLWLRVARGEVRIVEVSRETVPA